MKAKEIMSKPVLATTPRASLRDIATQLVVNSISGMPVADRKGTVLGIVTEADVLEAVKDGQQLEKLTATEVMSKTPVTVDVEVSIAEVINLLVEGGSFGCLLPRTGNWSGSSLAWTSSSPSSNPNS